MQDRDIARLQNGDLDAFGDLYERYADKIYSFLFYKTFDKEVAEDLTADTFLKAFKNRQSFHGNTAAEFSSWLYTIAYNNSVDHFRTHKPTDEIDESAEDLGFTEDTATQIDAKSKLDEILSFLDTLEKDQKDIIIMRLWDDLSYQEIAEITGKTPDNCRKIVSRVLAQIQSNITYMFLFCMVTYYIQK